MCSYSYFFEKLLPKVILRNFFVRFFAFRPELSLSVGEVMKMGEGASDQLHGYVGRWFCLVTTDGEGKSSTNPTVLLPGALSTQGKGVLPGAKFSTTLTCGDHATPLSAAGVAVVAVRLLSVGPPPLCCLELLQLY